MIKLFSKYIQAIFYSVLISSSSLYAICTENYNGEGLVYSNVTDNTYTFLQACLDAEDAASGGGSGSGTCTLEPIPCTTDDDCFGFGTCDIAGTANTPPTASNVTITGALTEGQTIWVNYRYSDPDNDLELGTTFKWFRADDSQGLTNNVQVAGGTFGTTTREYTLTSNDAGKYMQVWVYANDGKGAGDGVPSSLEGPVTAVAVNNPPVITSVPLTSATVDFLYSYDITANDTDGDSLNFRLVQGPIWLSLTGSGKNSAKLFGTPPNDGNYTISLVANDLKDDSTPQNFKIIVTTANTPPQITSSPDSTSGLSATVGTPYSYTIVATDKDGDDIDFNVILPNWLSYDVVDYGQIELFGDPSVSGDYDVNVTASDNEGNDTLNFTISVSGDSISNPSDDTLEIISVPETNITLEKYIRFTHDDATKTVYDNDTDTTWLDDQNVLTKRTWYEAVQYCNDLVHSGVDDWRLPYEEFGTILGQLEEAGFIYLKYGSEQYYWLNDTVLSLSYMAKVLELKKVSFYLAITWQEKSKKYNATCIRNGKLDSVTANGTRSYQYAIQTKNATGKVTYSLVEPSQGASWLKFDEETGTLSGTVTHKDIGDVDVTILVKDDLTEVTQSFTLSVSSEPEPEPTGCNCNIATYSSKPKNIDMMFILILITTLLYPFRKKFIKED